MDDSNKIKLFLTDEDQVMRDGLRTLFSNHPKITVVGEADNLKKTEHFVQKVKPNIITVGMNINGCNYFNIVKTLSKEFPDIKIIAHSAFTEKTFVSEVLKAGSCAYVHKDETFSELVKAIEAVINGEVYLCPRVANIVMNSYLKEFSQKDTSAETTLTERERDVLKLLADGKSSKEIALALYISAKTVDTHRRQIMNKVNLFSVPELTKFAIRCGLTSIN
jgi:DNA-binding NarL/FixJ family response regulator